MVRWLSAIILGILAPALSWATAGITYHGRLLKPDGSTPVEENLVQFRIQIRSPGNENCLLYSETHTRDMTGTSGIFAITINDGTASTVNAEPFSLDRVFQNRGTFSFAAGKCALGNTYTPAATDGRKLVVDFSDGTFAGFESLPSQAINFVPMALEAITVGGYGSGSMLRVNDGTGAPASISALTQTQYNSFLDLLAGTSPLYLTTSSSLNGANLAAGSVDDTKLANGISASKISGNISGSAAGFTGSLNGDVTGPQSATVVGKIQGRAVDSAAPTNGQVLKWNSGNSRWEPSADSAGGSGTVTSVTGTGAVVMTGTAADPVVGVQDASTSGKGVVQLATSGQNAANVVVQGNDSRLSDSRAPNGNAGGDLANTYPNPKVIKIQGFDIDTTTPVNGQFMKVVSSKWTPGAINLSDLKSSVAGSLFNAPSCASNQTLSWDSLSDQFSCIAISLNASAVTAGTMNVARLPVGTSAGTVAAGDDSRFTDARTPTAHTHPVDEITSAAGKYLTYKPNNVQCADGQVLKWINANQRWECAADAGAAGTIASLTVNSPLVKTGTASDPIVSIGDASTSAKGAVQLAASSDTTAGLVVQANDTRLSDARTPTAHTHVVDEILSAASKYFTYKPNNTACANGELLKWNSAQTRWECGTAASSESTTVSNIGTAGVGVYKQLTGTNIELKKLNAASSALALTDDTVNNKIDIGVNAELSGLAGLSANGFVKRTGAGTYSSASSINESDLNNAGSMAVNTGVLVTDGTQVFKQTCSGNQVLIWTVANGWSCSNVSAVESDPKVGANTTNYLSKWNGSALVASGVLDNGTNVGIGTTTAPTQTLHVRAAAGAPATSGSTQAGVLRIGNTANAAGLDIGQNSSSGAWLQSTNANNLATNYQLLLNPNGGNVGIGTTLANSLLEVGAWTPVNLAGVLTNLGATSSQVLPASIMTANTTTTGAYVQAVGLELHNNTTGATGQRTPALAFSDLSGSGSYANAIAGIDAVDAGAGGDANWRSGALAFHTAPVGGFGIQERMRIDAAGNVGIGTNNPTAKLHVAGTAGTDGIRFPDGTLQTTAFTAAGGGGSLVTKTANYNIVSGDNGNKILMSSSSATAANLPTAASVGNGFHVLVKRAGTGSVTLVPSGTDLIDGLNASFALGSYAALELWSDGTSWFILSQRGTVISPFVSASGGYRYNDGSSALSCKEYRSSANYNGEGSGFYWIDPDGPGGSASYKAYCDMVTDGGGWTMNLDASINLNYNTSSSQFINSYVNTNATEVMTYYASSTSGYPAVNEKFKFNKPSGFDPFGTTSTFAAVTVTNLNTSVVTTNSTLVSASWTFGSYACDAINTANSYGRFALCIGAGNGTSFDNFPFYSAYTNSGADLCSGSSAIYNSNSCSSTRFFVIFER